MCAADAMEDINQVLPLTIFEVFFERYEMPVSGSKNLRQKKIDRMVCGVNRLLNVHSILTYYQLPTTSFLPIYDVFGTNGASF